MRRLLIFAVWAALLGTACSRKTLPEAPLSQTWPSATAAVPDWVSTAGRTLRYPEATHLTGFGMAEPSSISGGTQEALRARATDLARTQLAERVMVKLKSETELLQENDRPDQIRVYTQTQAKLDLEGLQQEEYHDPKSGQYYVLAYARRDVLSALYAERARTAYRLLERAYRQGQRLEGTRPADALKAYRLAEQALGDYQEQALIARAIGSALTADERISTGPAEPLTADSVASRLAGLSERPISTLSDLAFSLALALHQQLILTTDTTGSVAIAPVTVEGSPFGSPLGRHLQGLVERELSRLVVGSQLRIVSYTTTTAGRPRADYVIETSYGLAEPSVVHSSFRRVMADGRSRLVATADRSAPLSVLRSAGLALEAEGGEAAREQYTEVTQTQLAATGGLALDVWTNRGRESAIAVEGDTVWVYLQTARPAFVRLLYRMADGRTVLLYDNFQVTAGQVGRAIRLPQAFVASAPFGAEVMIAMAADQAFAPLVTRAEDGYSVVVDNLTRAAMQSRGLTPVPSTPQPNQPTVPPYAAFGEKTLGITTLPRLN